MQSKSQDQKVDYADPDAGMNGEDHAATQLFVLLNLPFSQSVTNGFSQLIKYHGL
jgi:hypothetical protein